MKVVFNIEPTPQARPRVTRSGHAYTPAKCAAYRQAIRDMAVEAMDGKQPLTGALVVSLAFFQRIPESWSKKKKRQAVNGEIMPITRTGDIDNFVKGVLDSCNGVVYEDDSQICALNAIKCYAEEPQIVMSVTGVLDD